MDFHDYIICELGHCNEKGQSNASWITFRATLNTVAFKNVSQWSQIFLNTF